MAIIKKKMPIILQIHSPEMDHSWKATVDKCDDDDRTFCCDMKVGPAAQVPSFWTFCQGHRNGDSPSTPIAHLRDGTFFLSRNKTYAWVLNRNSHLLCDTMWNSRGDTYDTKHTGYLPAIPLMILPIWHKAGLQSAQPS